ncbi:MAG: hypothetical protein J5755_04765, partial [Clostridia bacterium]|nr:hypothetical protein [Clostridia bacterium]
KAIYVSGIEQGSTQSPYIKKSYDGTTAISKSYFCLKKVVYSGIVAGDTLGLDFSGVLEDKNAGEGKTATLVDLALTGDDAGNYYLPDEGQQTTVTGLIVEKRYLGAYAQAYGNAYYNNGGGVKEYNGTNQYILYASEFKVLGWLGGQDPIAGEDVSLDYIVNTVDNKNVGDKTMYYTHLTFYLKGADAANYTCGSNQYGFTSSFSFTVVAKPLTLTGVEVNDKTYDGTTTATFDLSGAVLSGVIAGDNVAYSVAGYFADRNVGNGKAVTCTPTLSGTDAGNYTVTLTQTNLSASIFPRPITVTAEDKTITYGDSPAELTYTMEGTLAEGDNVSDVFSLAKAGNASAGEYNITVELCGNDNYDVTCTNATYTINQKELTVTGIKGVNKTYDGTTDVQFDYDDMQVVGVIEGDEVEISVRGYFINGDVGNHKSIPIWNFTFGGRDGSNYTVGDMSDFFTYADITPAPIVVSGIQGVDRDYDGTTQASFDYSEVILDGYIAGDDLSVVAQGAFADKNAGEDKSVTITSLTLQGDDAGNYELDVDNIQNT